MPPIQKLPFIFSFSIISSTYLATAKDAPPAPVWKENPSFKYPECFTTCAANPAIRSPTGSRVIFVVPDTIRAGSPICETSTT